MATTFAGLALRLFFVFYFPAITDDSRIYADLATNWMQHGIYGHSAGGQIQPQAQKQVTPTDSRLPGYPMFLAAVFLIFGVGNMKAVMLVQVAFDLGTCLIVANLTRRLLSERSARLAFALTALCPFLANYSAAVLTESLEIFFTALALDCAAAALNHMLAFPGAPGAKRWAATGAAIAICILLRPDGGILLAAMTLYLAILAAHSLSQARDFRCPATSPAKYLTAALIVGMVALAPLAPWTLRNFHTMHHFQPLAPRYATDSDELVLRGFNRWVKTWMAEYASVEEIYWNVPGEKIDGQKLPARAFDTDEQRETTQSVIDDYNDSQDISPELDVRFSQLAEERIHAHPARFYVVLPLLRVVDVWLRPRTEMLPPDVRWWEFNDDAARSSVAVSFVILNFAYIAAALFALACKRSEIRWAGLLAAFLLLRSAFLGTMENPEPRYTLECYPAIIVLAAAAFMRKSDAVTTNASDVRGAEPSLQTK
jgi:4-amino-4-deoxy-L-arabinose transferase and related glycosyltransferases of PMT family